MIRYLYSSQLNEHADLGAAMFRDRAAQFRDRMGWDVHVDTMGWETDQYDVLDPLYLIAEDASGRHAGSMRFLPTTGPTMTADIFPHLTAGCPIRDPGTWECTRFCLAPDAGPGVARTLLIGASALGLGFGLRRSLGVFDRPMVRVYRRLGWEPEVLGTRDGISSGLWTFSEDTHDALCDAAGIAPGTTRDWVEATFADLPLSIRA